MTIGIEAERANSPKKTGVEHYAKQLIQHLAKIDRLNRYNIYLRTRPESWFFNLPSNFKIKVLPFPLFWTQLRLSWELFRHPVNALLIPASALPMVHPQKSVVTIHDLAWDFYPETFKLLTRLYLKFSTCFAVKFASQIIAVSQNTKEDLEKKFKIAAGKVTVVYHGFSLKSNSAEPQVKTLNLPERFIVYLSTLQPRKNHLGLIKAFSELKRENDLPHSLVLIGGKGWLYEDILKEISSHPEIVYLDYVANPSSILERAELLVQPSFYEGFGLQVLDAFAYNVPVACSKTSSLPEIAGDAAVYFDPNSPEEIKQAIKRVLLDKDLADSLRARGKRRLKEFTWEKTAQKTLNVITNA